MSVYDNPHRLKELVESEPALPQDDDNRFAFFGGVAMGMSRILLEQRVVKRKDEKLLIEVLYEALATGWKIGKIEQRDSA